MTVFTKIGYLPLALSILALTPAEPGSLALRHAGTTDARTAVESYYEQWRDLFERRVAVGDDEFADQLLGMVEQAFDMDGLALQILPDAGVSFTADERERFASALAVSVKNRIVSHVATADKPPKLRIGTVDERKNDAIVECSVETGDAKRDVTLYLIKTSADVWKIRDVHTGTERITGFYGSYVDDLLEEYSFAYMVARLSDAPFVVLEDFEASAVGELPLGWQWKGKDDDKRKPYRVAETGGNKYLSARDEGESVIIAKDVKWDLEEYPYVSFRWRVYEIPEGADERFHDKVDSAAGIYFVYRRVLGLIPESVKYVWSSTLPVGSAMQRSGLGKPWMVVADSGRDGLGEWRTHVFDFVAAYKETFGGLPPNDAVGIAILSDANNTVNGHAYADYDDIRAVRSVDSTVTSGVQEKLEAQ